jgi:hypothetical protein
MNRRWRGRACDQPQIANANQDFLDLAPVSDVPAEQTRSNWAALLPDTNDVPLIWEDSRYGYQERAEQDRVDRDC